MLSFKEFIKEQAELEEGHFDNKPSQGAKVEPAKGKSLRDKLMDPEFREKYKKDMNKMYGIKEPKNEDVEYVDEGNAENKAKKNAFAKKVGTKALSLLPPKHADQYRKSSPGGSEGAKAQVGRTELRGYVTDKIEKRSIAKNPSEFHKRKGNFSGRHLSSPRATDPDANPVRFKGMSEGNAENKAKKNVYVKGVGKAVAQRQFDRESKISNVARLSKLAGRITSSNSDPKSHEYMVRTGRKKLKKVVGVRPNFGAPMPRHEAVEPINELHADTLRSYISKRYKPNLRDKANGPTYMHNGPGGDPVAQKQIKGIDNAHKSLTKKYASKLKAASDNAAAASYNKSKPGTYHGD